MASLPTRTTASFDAIKPVSSLVLLDNEFNQYVGGAGFLNGNSTATKLLVKSTDAADPPLEIDQIGAGPLAEWKQNGVLKADIANNGVMTLTAIPVGPAADPTIDNQFARKNYVDSRKVSFSASFGIPDPSTANLSSPEFGSIIIPSGGLYTVGSCKIVYVTGSHTPGGSVTFIVQQQGVGTRATLVLNDTNNTVNTVFTDDVVDFTVAANSILTVLMSARSGTITERNVSVTIEGSRVVF